MKPAAPVTSQERWPNEASQHNAIALFMSKAYTKAFSEVDLIMSGVPT